MCSCTPRLSPLEPERQRSQIRPTSRSRAALKDLKPGFANTVWEGPEGQSLQLCQSEASAVALLWAARADAGDAQTRKP